MRSGVLLFSILLGCLPACRSHPSVAGLPAGASCWSIDGRALTPAAIPDATRDRMEQQLSHARVFASRHDDVGWAPKGKVGRIPQFEA